MRARGKLNCIINTGLAGFAAPDDKGKWTGFDVDFCRAVAAATLGDADKVNYTTATGKTRFTKLAAGEGEILSRNTTWTFSRDVDLSQTFVGVSYYDGQGFMVPKALGVKSAKGLDGASVCIQTGTTTELNLAEFFAGNGMNMMTSYCDIILGNEEDAEMHFGIKPKGLKVQTQGQNIEADAFLSVCEQMMKKFPRAKKVITTLRGSISASHNSWSGILYDGKRMCKTVKYQITDIVDRVGGGDSFMGGLIYLSLIHI